MDFDFARLAGNEAGTRAAGGRVLIVAESMRLPSGPERTRRAAAAADAARPTRSASASASCCARAPPGTPALARQKGRFAVGARPRGRPGGRRARHRREAPGAVGDVRDGRMATRRSARSTAGAETERWSTGVAAEGAALGGRADVLPAADARGKPPVKYVKMRGSARARRCCCSARRRSRRWKSSPRPRRRGGHSRGSRRPPRRGRGGGGRRVAEARATRARGEGRR